MEPGLPYVDLGATASDPEQGDLTDAIVISGDDFDSNVPGHYVITYNVADRAGNAAVEVVRVITVADTKSPVLSFPAGIESVTLSNGGSGYSDPVITVAGDGEGALFSADLDEGSGEIIAINIVDPGEGYTSGIINILDENGLGAIAEIKVSDLTEVVAQMGVPFRDPGFRATDEFEGDLTPKVDITGDTIDINTEGVYNVKYTVSDAAGNTTELVRSVTVEDSLPPDIVLNGPGQVAELLISDSGEGYESVDILIHGDGSGAQATAELDESTGALVRLILTDGGSGYTYATVEIDGKGEGSGAVAKAVVRTIPIMSLEASIEGSYVDLGAIAFDAVDGNLTSKIEVDGIDDVDLSKPGEYTITYTVSDEQGNEGKKERSVIVQDTTEPVIILNGSGAIAEIHVSDKGFNYLDANVIIEGDGEGARAIAVLANGFISSIQLLDPGFGYSTASVTIEGSGVGAKADVVIDNGLNYFVEADSDPELHLRIQATR